MNLEELSASELARIDAICLEYESQYRQGNQFDIREFLNRYTGAYPDLVEKELEAVRQELQSNDTLDGRSSGQVTPSVSQTPDIPPPGTRLGPYIVGELIGRGGMGVVLAAIDQRLDRRVAIKILATEIARRSDLTERFDREARAVAKLSHPNIVELFDVGSYEGLPYAVMEYLDGELLSDRLTSRPLTKTETRRLGSQIADALEKAHQFGVIHRDLKPQNVMLIPQASSDSEPTGARDDFLVKLFDFGLSRAPRSIPAGKDDSSSVDQTQAGAILGTPGYMAPEQALGEPTNAAADIFALGCILFEAFYRQRAFDGDSKIKRHQATLVDHPRPDPIRRRDDPEMAALIDQCLAKDPQERPESAALIARQLRHHSPATDLITEARQQGRSAGRFTRRRLVELAVGGTAGGVLAMLLGRQTTSALSQVSSIAVLSFTDETEPSQRWSADPVALLTQPVSDNELGDGEKLAAMLVHELSQIPNIVVPPYRPIMARRPDEYQRIGELLSVDALLDGRISTEKVGTKYFYHLDVRVVSADDGNQIDGFSIHADADNNFLEKSQFAAEIASRIGHRLTATVDTEAPPSPESFRCLVDGQVRCDPDCPDGLEMALKCFAKAHQEDIRYAKPLAGIAVTSLLLAAQSSPERAIELVEQARENAAMALERSPTSPNAKLALAMLDWQSVQRFAQADQKFQALLDQAPNSWAIQHQYGLLQLAMGKSALAIELLRTASLLNPMSVTVKTDLARAHWYAGDAERALEDAKRIQQNSNDHPLSLGLLIDLQEHFGKLTEAARLHHSMAPIEFSGSIDAEDYYAQRRTALTSLPYGPFGTEMNQAIWQSRVSGISSSLIANLADSPTPLMFTLLLANHPAFETARTFPRAIEVLERLKGLDE